MSEVINAHDLGIAGGYIIEDTMRRTVDQLESENAKLRELVDYMTPIALYGASEQERDRMRELGVDA